MIMKYLYLIVLLLCSALLCKAQIAAPDQTDTLVICSVKYNYADIRKENWPCDLIYKSTKDFLIGERTFNISGAEKIGGVVCFVVYDINDPGKKEYELLFKESDSGSYLLSFSGYQFDCYIKGEEPVSANGSRKNDSYVGVSIRSYNLNGRKATNLKIPACRCCSDGEVAVMISVSPTGQVVNAKIKDDVSSSDECLRSFALRAARLSRFSANTDAKSVEYGEIIYVFGSGAFGEHIIEADALLADRRINGTLPVPVLNASAFGKVVVEIWVDNYGNVQKAVAGAEGTSMSDDILWQAARKAALQTHFNVSADAPALQKGTITYIFK